MEFGYLGVDIFFVISGYLITYLLYNNRYKSLTEFYINRIRRIIPLTLFTTLVALAVGAYLMLPDDLENLSQSAIASNTFTNNILLLKTTVRYWDPVNDYKPLMHTWSLAIEEQFYIAYPLLFFVFKNERRKWVLPILVTLSFASLANFILSNNDPIKFYLLQFRFFELSIGGILAIITTKKLLPKVFSAISLVALVAILLFTIPIQADYLLIIAVISTGGIIASKKTAISTMLLENSLIVWIGKISFSLYMWHQVVLAFIRYSFINEMNLGLTIAYFTGITILSLITFRLIEKPLRDNNIVSNKYVIYTLLTGVLTSISISGYLLSASGVVRDVPELQYWRGEKNDVEIHRNYNLRVHGYEVPFEATDKIKVLVVGNSFARDWANILLESNYKDSINITYIFKLSKQQNLNFLHQADFIFFSESDSKDLSNFFTSNQIDTTKVWNIGTKSFGTSNGQFYLQRNKPDYCSLRAIIPLEIQQQNESSNNQWGSKYVDLIGAISEDNNSVPVFTPDCKFISHDCRHLTQSGAKYYAIILENELHTMFN